MEKGFSAVSMDAIAEAAPVSKPTLYQHFKDKEALFTAVMTDRCQQIFAALENSFSSSNIIEDNLFRFADQFTDLVFSQDAIKMHRVMIMEAAQFSKVSHYFYEIGPQRSLQILSDYFARLHKDQKLYVPSPDMSAGFFISMIKGYTHTQLLMNVRSEISRQEKNKLIKTAVAHFMAAHKI